MLLAQAMKGEIIKYNSLIKAIKPRPAGGGGYTIGAGANVTLARVF